MNSLYPGCEPSVRAPRVLVPTTPDPNQTKAEIEYLVESFRVQTEYLKRTGRLVAGPVPAAQPDLPGT